MSSPYQETNKFTDINQDCLDSIREGLSEFEKFGFDNSWADQLIESWEREIYALSEALNADKDEFTPNNSISGLMLNREGLVETLEKYKWVSIAELELIENNFLQQIQTQLSQLNDSMLYDLYKEYGGSYDSFDEFRETISEQPQSHDLDISQAHNYRYNEIPEIGEKWVVEVVESDVPVLGAYDLANNPEELQSNFTVWRTAEIVEFVAPESKEMRAYSHPFAKVDVDGDQYILPPGCVIENVDDELVEKS